VIGIASILTAQLKAAVANDLSNEFRKVFAVPLFAVVDGVRAARRRVSDRVAGPDPPSACLPDDGGSRSVVVSPAPPSAILCGSRREGLATGSWRSLR
jgi:hypothetical protein